MPLCKLFEILFISLFASLVILFNPSFSLFNSRLFVLISLFKLFLILSRYIVLLFNPEFVFDTLVWILLSKLFNPELTLLNPVLITDLKLFVSLFILLVILFEGILVTLLDWFTEYFFFNSKLLLYLFNCSGSIVFCNWYNWLTGIGLYNLNVSYTLTLLL
jgi:hypothetical protein